MIVAPRVRHWLAVVALAVMWGSAYALNEIALASFTPLEITALRLVFAALTSAAIMLALGLGFPAARRWWVSCVLVSVVGNCLPFLLVAAGQVYIASNLAGLLLATTPLFVLLLAHLALPDERLTPGRGLGFVLGFAGVALLIGPGSLQAAGGNWLAIAGQAAVLGAAFCYAAASVLVRRAPSSHVIVFTTGVMLVGTLILVPAALLNGELTPARLAGAGRDAWLSVAALGVVVTGLAAVVFFNVVRAAGASFQALTNYLIPLWAVFLGWFALGETLPSRALLAMPLILLGLLVAQFGFRGRAKKTAAG